MGTIHAFLAGIDAYPPQTAAPLTGCVNDVTQAAALLAARTGGTAETRIVVNEAVTAAAVEDGIAQFLGAAGPGDTALFWFSGHGTQQAAYGTDLLIESTGRNQALMCVDEPLPDKRLGALLDGVAARGAHVAAVLDCCFSGGATRDGGDLTARFTPPPAGWSAPTVRDMPVPAGQDRHVLLAASRLDQLSYEGYFDGRRHGAFSYALLAAAREPDPAATYRELLSAADALVQRTGGHQQPVLYPATPGGPADLPFLSGALARTPSTCLLRNGRDGWEVDCGTGHGLRDGTAATGTEFTVVGDADPAVVRAREIRVDRTLVDPVGWTPEARRAYPVALSALALPMATVALDLPPQADSARLLADALGSAGPGGGPAALLRLVDGPQESADLHFRVAVRSGSAHVLRRDGTAFTAPLPLAGPADARRIVGCLTHLTRWHRLRELRPPRPSELDNLVRVEITPWDAPPDQLLVPDGSGEIVCSYASEGAGPREPWVSIRLHNRSPDRQLWCLLLDLTDGYASHSLLYPGHFIAPGHFGHALDGGPVQLSLPAARPAVPGAQVRDWLKLIVAEGELNPVPFHLPPWDPAAESGRAGSAAEQPHTDGTLRLTGPRRQSGARELGRPRDTGPGRWATRTVALRTVVPH
ncbi:caspase family protein [Streptomyces sp. NPDC004732]|uniref:caspase family protein n=1 Tax=Streptomyces sp. NPDC004732 TaxID=3154290 RepID=UPI00339ECFAD